LGYPVEYGQTPIVIGAQGLRSSASVDRRPLARPIAAPLIANPKRFLACNRRETICARDEAILSAREDRLKPEPGINEATRTTRLVMWDVIIRLIYHRSCRNYRAAARKRRRLISLWA
jgi:hypothetical protein